MDVCRTFGSVEMRVSSAARSHEGGGGGGGLDRSKEKPPREGKLLPKRFD